jgi:hypothetical protein
MDGLILAADVVGWLQAASRSVERFFSDFGAVDWVLIALGFAALGWLGASLRSMTRLGPIEVATLDHDGDHTAKVLALTATLRERLERVGLVPPPSVPTGAPHADLIAAVEASPIPQAQWIGKMLAILPIPRPPRYKVTGTLRGEEPSPQATALFATIPDRTPCGISFWLSPEREGTPLLDTVPNCASHNEAVLAAATKIYMHIAMRAVEAFPLWVRWPSEHALGAYVGGCRYQTEGKWAQAEASLECAAAASPFNALARLQLGNLYEQRAGVERAPFRKARMQAEALRRYLEVARPWPALVEARYRTSVIAAILAASYKQLGRELDEEGFPEVKERLIRAQLLRIRDQVQLQGATENAFADQLDRLARAESAAVLQLLKPWYALLHGRLRNQFEPKAHERRALKHVVRISKQCVRLRARSKDTRRLTRMVVQYRALVVHFFHMLFGLGNLTWQAKYNAACFDALLLARPEPQRGQPRIKWLGNLGQRWRQHRDRVRRERALRNLDRAARDAGPELSPVWVAEADPDLAVFRHSKDERFDEIVSRLPQDPIKEVAKAEEQAPPVAHRKPIPPPDRPWGSPQRRYLLWLAVGSVYLAVVVTLAAILAPAFALLLVALVLPAWRIGTAVRDRRLDLGAGSA